MKKNLNLKCLALSICCFVIGFFFRISYLHLGLNQLLFSFVVGLSILSMMYFLLCTFNFKDRFRQLITLTIGLIVIKLVISSMYDSLFITQIAGIAAGGLLCCVTFIRKIDRWLIK